MGVEAAAIMKARRWIEVVGWDRFQHYKQRRPTWIKLYVGLLDNADYRQLEIFHRALLTDLWLLYAKSGCEVPASPSYISHELGYPSQYEVERARKWLVDNAVEPVDNGRPDGQTLARRWPVDGQTVARIEEMAGQRPVRSRDLKRLEQAGFLRLVARRPLATRESDASLEVEKEREIKQQHELRNRSEYAAAAEKDDKTDNNLERRLALAGWNRDQRAQALTDPARAQAWLEADTTRTASKPGAYAWAGFQSGDWPARGVEPRKTGWRAVRGTHSGTHIPDPDGTDTPPRLASDRPSP